MKKQVKIIGLSVNKDFGGLKATELTFDENNKLTLVKGEVGSGKTTLNRALSLTTKGSKTLADNNLYGDVDLTAQLLDGEHKVFVECKSSKDGKLVHTIYTIDKDGNKLKDVVIDGKKLTPANYLSSLQTSLTWRLDELTSENPTTQRNLLLELYQSELEDKGVIFEKKHPKYVGGIIDKIEKAKNDRNYADMKRKEVGGIADDLRSKGIDFEERRIVRGESVLVAQINDLTAQITLAKTNVEQQRESQLNALKAKGSEINGRLRDVNDGFKAHNSKVSEERDGYNKLFEVFNHKIASIKSDLYHLNISNDNIEKIIELVLSSAPEIEKPKKEVVKELQFNEKGQCTSNPNDFDTTTSELLTEYRETGIEYARISQLPLTAPDTTELESQLAKAKTQLESLQIWNKEAIAINALHDWKDANETVKNLQSDFYMKLTEIETGVKGLYIAPESKESQNIYLMYNGEYDTEYFHNPNKELRKLSSYSDTQKPLICLLIQQYMLSKKGKTLPYLWIDKVPIDNKTRDLLEKMSNDLDLWLFVSWTGDFSFEGLNDGELLLENGEIFFGSPDRPEFPKNRS